MRNHHTVPDGDGTPKWVPCEPDPDEQLERYRDEEDFLRAEESLREDAAETITITPLGLALLAELSADDAEEADYDAYIDSKIDEWRETGVKPSVRPYKAVRP